MEAVFLSLSQSFVAVLVEQGHRSGRLISRLRANLDGTIAAILTLNTIANTAGGAIVGAMVLEVFGDRWVAGFSAVFTVAVLIFSEIIPKTIGAIYWQQLAPVVAYPLTLMVFVLKPLLLVLSVIGRILAPRGPKRPTVSRAELEILAQIGHREGTIDEEEYQMVTRVIQLDEIVIREVMTPRTEIIGIPVSSTLAEAESLMLASGHSRMPVYEGSLDKIVGIVLGRDLWKACRQGGESLDEIVRAPRFVPESKPVEDLTREMRRERIQIAIVIDEYGGTAGLVTLEDLIEEIVGEIHDEHDAIEKDFEEIDGELRIEGGVPLWEVNEKLQAHLPEEEYDTLGGFVFGALGRMPRSGDLLEFEELKFRVLRMDGRRVGRVSVRRLESPDAPAEKSGAAAN
jgi:putative hemolysin